MEETTEKKIRADNKKALPKYLGIMFCCFLLGFVMAILAGGADKYGMRADMVPALQTLLGVLPVFVLPAICVILLIPSLVVMKKAKTMWKGWDGEDDTLPERVEAMLDKLLLLQNTTGPLAYLTFTLDAAYDHERFRSAAVLVFFALYIFLLVWQQKRVVDFNRLMNPEKQGSLYDLNFQNKWVASCDEAEKKLLGEAALSTFFVMGAVYIVTWIVMMFLRDLFNFGIMPAVVPLVLWGIHTTVFQVKGILLNKHQ